MKTHFLAASAVVAMLGHASPAAADTVCEWMDFANKVIDASQPPASVPRTPDHDQVYAHVALAMFEALNAIDRRYESYLKLPLGEADGFAGRGGHHRRP